MEESGGEVIPAERIKRILLYLLLKEKMYGSTTPEHIPDAIDGNEVGEWMDYLVELELREVKKDALSAADILGVR